MSETLTIFTVPDKWGLDSSVKESTILQKIVGIIAVDGEELWVPGDPKKYMYSGGYSEGYSMNDVQETELTLQKGYTERLINFFRVPLLEHRWYDVGLTLERYDCHWFGGWMKGLVSLEHKINYSLDIASDTIERGSTVKNLPEGKIGVVGGKSPDEIVPDHTFLGVDSYKCLQVSGIHGPVVIAPQEASVQHYTEISDFRHYIDQDSYGLHVIDAVA